MTTVDLDRVASALDEVAQTEVMPRWRNLAELDIRQKSGPKDLVTVADEAAEKLLEKLLPDLLPGSVIIGEESVEKDRRLLSVIGEDAPVWIVDPIDGTGNFAEGTERFCVMAALAHRGETIAGAIHQPVLGRTVVAARGEGAWMLEREERRRLRVAEPADLDAMEGSFNFRFFAEPLRAGLRERANAAFGDRHHRYGCAGFDYVQLATGAWHFAVYWKNMPWDHAAGLLIHAEAGGSSGRLDGRPYRPTELEGGILAAVDQDGWALIRDRVVGEID